MAELPVSGTIEPEEAVRFSSGLLGELITPGHADYETRRAVWNGMIDRRPALIARCAGTVDVLRSLDFARRNRMLVSVRGGAHNVAGHATNDGGLVIDLSPMKAIVVDPEARTAKAGAGVTWGELDAATQAFGLATPGGVFSGTGIAGLTLGGGYGWLRNRYGLSCDNLIGAEVVTAAAQVVRAGETENADLLWGLRGGGGNFGVVTQFEFRLHPVGPEVMFVFEFLDGRGEQMKECIRFYRDYCAASPDEVSTIGFLGMFPPGAPHFPPEVHGLPFFGIGALYAGPVTQGKSILQPLREFKKPLVDFSGVMPYVEAQKMFDEDYPDGWRYYWKSTNLTHLDDAAVDALVESGRRMPSPYSTIDIWHVGGAVSRGSAEQSAFFGRQAAFLVNPEANWEHPEEDEENVQWVRDTLAALKPFSDGSRYLNFARFLEEKDELVRSAFGPQYARLVELKRKYDPENLFRINQNIQPGP